MSELSAALGNAAPPHQILHEGRAYSFYLLDGGRRSEFEKRLYQRAREGVYTDRDHMSEDQYLKRLDAVREQYENNEYAMTGERGQKALQTPSGAMLLLEIITGESQADLTPLLLMRGPEVTTLIKTVMDESFKKPRKASPNG